MTDAPSLSDADHVRKILAQIANTYRGTPWEFLARREAQRALGLRWEPLLR